MVLGGIADATCAQIPSLDAVWVAIAARTATWLVSVLCGHLEPGLWVWECSTDHC